VILVAQVPVLHRRVVVAADDAELQVVADFAEPDLVGRHARKELHHVGIARGRVVLLHQLRTVATGHQVVVVAGATDQGVGAHPAIEHIVARVTRGHFGP